VWILVECLVLAVRSVLPGADPVKQFVLDNGAFVGSGSIILAKIGSQCADAPPVFVTGNFRDTFTAPANSGATSTPEILGGRLITINRGPAWPGVEALRFHLRENATVTVQ